MVNQKGNDERKREGKKAVGSWGVKQVVVKSVSPSSRPSETWLDLWLEFIWF